MAGTPDLGFYPGGDPGRLPGAYLGGTQESGTCSECGCRQCECDSPAPPVGVFPFSTDVPADGACPADAFESPANVAFRSAGAVGTGPSGASTGALSRAGEFERTARRVGARLPRVSPPGSCASDAGPCGLWMNPRGNLVRTVGPPLSGGLAAPLVLTHNSMAAATSSVYGRGWSLNLGRRVISAGGGNVVLVGPQGTQYSYSGTTTMSSGERYAPPEGVRSSLLKLDDELYHT